MRRSVAETVKTAIMLKTAMASGPKADIKDLFPAKPPKGPKLSPRDMPLRVMPFNGTVAMTCTHCYLHIEYNIGELVKDYGYENRSVEQLEEKLVCTRKTCLGSLALTLSLGE